MDASRATNIQKMKPIYKNILLIFLGIGIAILFFKGCENSVGANNAHTDSSKILKSAQKKIDSLERVGDKLAITEKKVQLLVKLNDSLYRVASRKYTSAKSYTLPLPCDSAIKYVIQACDTLQSTCDSTIASLYNLVAVKDSIHSVDEQIIQVDSMFKSVLVAENKELKKENKKLKRKVIFWKVLTFISGGLNGYQTIKK